MLQTKSPKSLYFGISTIAIAIVWTGTALGQFDDSGVGAFCEQPRLAAISHDLRSGYRNSSQSDQDKDDTPENNSPEIVSKLTESQDDTEKDGIENGEGTTRDTMTGNWNGRRDALAEAGLTLDWNGTYVFQGVAGGGLTSPLFPRFSDEGDTGNTFANDLTLELDTEKAGFWQAGLIRFRIDSRAGVSVVQRAGSVTAVNNEALFPNVIDEFDDATFAITEWTYEHALSESISLYGGLLNTAEGDENEIAGWALSSTHFLNSALLYSLVEDATVPNTSLGWGISYEPNESVAGSVSVMGTTETAGEDPFENWNGTTFCTEWSFGHELAECPGAQTIGFLYGIDARRIDIAADRRHVIGSVLFGLPIPTTDSNTWAVYYNTHQFLSGDSERGWGLFGRWGISDGNPNVVQWNAAMGLGGKGPFAKRPQDRWGLGSFYLSMSDADLLRSLGVGDEVGGEFFYNVVLASWFQITFDTQVIDSALPNVDTTTVLALRTHIIF